MGLIVLIVVAISLIALVIIAGGLMLVKLLVSRPARLEGGDGQPLPLPSDQQHSELGDRRCPACSAELPEDSPMGLCPQCLLQCALSKRTDHPHPGESGETSAYRGPASAPPVADLAPLFPQLEILELIGQGGMGAVYKARQTKLDRLVAIKILPAEWGNDPAFAERFTREARALARLSHSRIVAIHDFGESGGLFYLVMEYVDGCNLRQLLSGGPLQPELALSLVPQICAALQYAHGEGVVHRDIKPENILLDQRGHVKIADFGLAKLTRKSAAEYTLTGTQQVMGTINYMAPEQRTSPQDVDHRADIYAVGVVLYEMLTGEVPLGRFAAPSETAKVDARFDAVVFRAMEKEPEKRYQRISELKGDVEAITRSSGMSQADRSAIGSGQKPARGIGGKARSILGQMITMFVHRPTAVSVASAPDAGRKNRAPEKGLDTPMRQTKSTDIPVVLPARRPRHSGRKVGLFGLAFLVIFCGCLGFIAMMGFGSRTAFIKQGFGNNENPEDASRVDGTASLAFHRGDISMLVPIHDPWGAPGERQTKIRNILRAADEEYLKIELRYTKRQVDAIGARGQSPQPLEVTATVKPFTKELKTLEDRVWDQLKSVLTIGDEMPKAKSLLPIRGSLFPFGAAEVTLQITKTYKTAKGTVFHWRITMPGDPGEGQWFEGPRLPSEYARFWTDYIHSKDNASAERKGG